MVEGEGFEPSKLTQQIYSLPPLTARESLRKELAIIRKAFVMSQVLFYFCVKKNIIYLINKENY